MTTIREVLFDLVFNAFLQIGFFAVVAAVFSSFVAKAKAKYQHSFYLGVLILCLAVPVINTLWHTHRSVIAEKSPQDAVHRRESSDHYFVDLCPRSKNRSAIPSSINLDWSSSSTHAFELQQVSMSDSAI
jgi:hypothetical protein